MRLFFALLYIFFSFSVSATQWLKFDEKTFLVAPQPDARYLTSNQAVLAGQQCAAIVDAHGDFSALENFASEVKKRITQPICHLISTSSDEEQILGMILLSNEFPDAIWHAPNYVINNFADYKNAFNDKLERFESSLTLSKSRFELQNNETLRQRLKTAHKRLINWRSIQILTPAKLVNTPKNIELGEHKLIINTFQGATQSDLSIFSHYNSGLFAGLTVNPIPYVQHHDLKQWLEVLTQFTLLERATWLLPSHGKPYKNKALRKPIIFLESVLNMGTKNLPDNLIKLHKQDEVTQTRLRLMYELAKAKQVQGMQKQRTVL